LSGREARLVLEKLSVRAQEPLRSATHQVQAPRPQQARQTLWRPAPRQAPARRLALARAQSPALVALLAQAQLQRSASRSLPEQVSRPASVSWLASVSRSRKLSAWRSAPEQPMRPRSRRCIPRLRTGSQTLRASAAWQALRARAGAFQWRSRPAVHRLSRPCRGAHRWSRWTARTSLAHWIELRSVVEMSKRGGEGHD
jgi:hypothetical protein